MKLADVASDLLLSTRTLQRRLADAGLAYQMLLDTTRHELACHYLSRSAMPISEVGLSAGLSGLTGFQSRLQEFARAGTGTVSGRGEVKPLR